jgi:hypothetical protein
VSSIVKRLRAWVVTADMGLGHQRAAHPLAHLAEDGIVTAGGADFTAPDEVAFWDRLRWGYEFLSRCKGVPVVGPSLFALIDALLRIPPFYPLRDLSHPSLGNYLVDRLIRQGLGRTLLERLRTQQLPLVSTFYAPALIADRLLDHQNYCALCDADLNRVWVASNARRSRIEYFAPCGRVMRRLRQYGVPDERIFITGFPLPMSNVGGPDMAVLKSDLLARIGRLDPRGRFLSVYGRTVEELLGASPVPSGGRSRVTVTFAVGGAGAQTEIALMLLRSLRTGIVAGGWRLVLVAGVNRMIESLFRQAAARLGLEDALGDGVVIVCESTKPAYFDRFNAILRETDILWTKPSELVFFTALGVPIVMAPPIGPQEDKNARWLMDKNCAVPQEAPLHAHEWLADLLKEGVFAERALSGFVKNRKLGVHKMEEVLATGRMSRETHPLRR